MKGPRLTTTETPHRNKEHLNLDKLKKKEIELKKKEKELLKKDKLIQQKIIKYKKKKNIKAKADLRAAAKLKKAKKNLLIALDKTEVIKGKNSKTYRLKSKKQRKKKKKARHKRAKSKKKTKTVTKSRYWNPLCCLSCLFKSPCKCLKNTRRRRRRANSDPGSFLQRLWGFNQSCSCKNPKKVDKPGFDCFNPCRCENGYSFTETNWQNAAGDCYLKTLRRPPQPWIYHRFPKLYPHYVETRHQCSNIKNLLLLLAAFLCWSPCFLCLQLCKCCFCTCSTDY